MSNDMPGNHANDMCWCLRTLMEHPFSILYQNAMRAAFKDVRDGAASVRRAAARGHSNSH